MSAAAAARCLRRDDRKKINAEGDFEPWTFYAGVPIRPIKTRNREAILAQRDQVEAYLQARRKEVA